MPRIFGILVLVLSILFFPPSVLALISNNAVPGELTYPVKIKLEDAIVFLTSFNSNTKIWFSVTRSDRRFQEASILLNRGETASRSLAELVTQTDIAAKEISQITNQNQKQEFINNLQQSIQKYDDGLSAIQQKQQITPVIPISTSTPAPTPTPPFPSTAPPKSAPLPAPTNSAKPQPTVTAAPPPAAPVIQPLPNTAVPTEVKNNEEEIKKARENLKEIKKKLVEERKEKQENRDREKPFQNPPTPEKERVRRDQSLENNSGKK